MSGHPPYPLVNAGRGTVQAERDAAHPEAPQFGQGCGFQLRRDARREGYRQPAAAGLTHQFEEVGGVS